MGYMAWGYTKMFALTGDVSYRERARSCFEWLMEHRAKGSGDDFYCWGNQFSFSTRAGTIPAETPTIVWSSLIGQAFLEAYDVMKDPAYLRVAQSTAAWIQTLPREQTASGLCISYVPFMQSSIHNSNMLGAALLARAGAHTGDRAALELACEAMTYSCSRQLPDGAWFYGEAPKYHWIDSFHTGYNLDSLRIYERCTGDRRFEENFRLGLTYFMDNFFDPDGRTKYYHDRTPPLDIQCAAQAIDTLSAAAEDDNAAALELACRVATWTICNMQDRDGHFYYRDLGWKKIKTPMLHWGQGTMFKALTHLLGRFMETTAAAGPAAQSNEAVR
jgi:hypothetical protein